MTEPFYELGSQLSLKKASWAQAFTAFCFLGLGYSNHDFYTGSVGWDVEISLTSSSYLCRIYCHKSESNGNHLNPNSLSKLSRKPLGTVAMTTVCRTGAWEKAWCVSSHRGSRGPPAIYLDPRLSFNELLYSRLAVLWTICILGGITF